MNSSSILVVGRILMSLLFILSALKAIFFDFNSFSSAVESKQLPLPTIVAVIALSMKLTGGLFLATDYHSLFGAYVLLVFTIMATVLFHNVFEDSSQFNNMFKNIAIIGGLLIFIFYKLNY
jgi:putative oxidoreductase